VGFYKDVDELREKWGIEYTWKPQMESAKRERLYAGWKKAVSRSLNWVE